MVAWLVVLLVGSLVCWVGWLAAWLVCGLVGFCWFVWGWLTAVFYLGVVVQGLLGTVGGRLEKWFQMHVCNQSLLKIQPGKVVDKL